ncbi:MAG: hypothetical protein L3J43_09070 [Sulfurovum sp.]|nr:hypothetical protein [Sulfurovum sp.]
MQHNYVFFRLHSEEVPAEEIFGTVLKEYDIEIFVPSIFKLKRHSTKILIYMFWFLFTKGQYRIIYIKKDNSIIHYTHILPKFFKFPFMNVNDLEIGPSWTDEVYRGKGIFPAVIAYAMQYFKEENRTFYAFANIKNNSSQKAILKADFYKWMHGYKTNKLGIYKVKEFV